MEARKIEVRGLVQGVGFRPFICRLASKHQIKGWVDNRPDAVYIHAEGDSKCLDGFQDEILTGKPLPALIASIIGESATWEGHLDFQILQSKDDLEVTKITEVSPDIAVCDECLEDMERQAHRIDYPFINCTNCGPRFSIIRDLPYDRGKTTMSNFTLCSTCQVEYNDILDRRYHAQPIACNRCGPKYSLRDGNTSLFKLDEILGRLNEILSNHGLVAFKGLGGYNLACDARDELAVSKLRTCKSRETKPFAVMFADSMALEEYADISAEEHELLASWQRPIVIVDSKRQLAPSVSNGFNTIGAFLPYLPVHYLLFRSIESNALVMTSGNISEEPIIISDEEAQNLFLTKVDAILQNDRDIHNRVDDSVSRVIDGIPMIMRRSRGYAPSPLRTDFPVDGIFAAGAELSSCFAIGKNNQAILSQHIGDLKNLETNEFYEETYHRYRRLFRFEPELAVVDLHPDYLSTRFAEGLGIPILRVQHHHAHVVACMAENNHHGPVIGLSFDGTGMGSDGKIWGSEFLVCDYQQFERKLHFDYVKLPGGDHAVMQPWRIGLSYLLKYIGEDAIKLFKQLPIYDDSFDASLDLVRVAIQNNINAPESCSAGRLFDAVAALTGICIEPGFHAEAPMRLESAAQGRKSRPYSFTMDDAISFGPTLHEMMEDLMAGVHPGDISSRFHATVAQSIVDGVELISKSTHIAHVALSGGVFQNKLLSEWVINELKIRGYKVMRHQSIPCNDGGLALGQIMMAAQLRQHNKL